MRARSVLPLLFSCCLVLLLAAAMLSGLGGAPSPASAASLIWRDLGGPAGGPAQALALSPGYPADAVVLAGGGRSAGVTSWDGLGLFHSIDGGLTWTGRSGPPNGALLDVAFSPRWQADGFAVAGFWQGVWSTSDRGATWQMLSSMDTSPPSFVKAVAVASPAAGQHTLLAGGPYGGVYRSADAGLTWTYSGDPGAVNRLQFHPQQPDIALAATNTGLWRSTDAGLQWTRVTTQTVVDDVAFAADGSAVALYEGRGWRSDDGGATWEQLGGPAIDGLRVLGLSADGAGLFAAAGAQLYRYDAAAGEFVPVLSTPPLSRILRLAPSPTFANDQILLLGTYDGVWRSSNGGADLVRSAGFAPLRVYSMTAAGNALAGDLYAGTEYGVWRQRGGVWQPLNTNLELGGAPPVRSVALSPAYAQDNTLFVAAASSSGLGAAVYRSTDRGATWQRLVGAEYIDQLVVSPAFAGDRRLYMVGTQRISTSSDGGNTWTVQPFWDFTHTARTLAIAPGFGQEQTLVAFGSGVYRSVDGGATWSEAASPPSATNGWQPGRLHWSADGRLYLTIYWFEAAAPYTRHDQLWSSDDQGQTWNLVRTAPDLPVAGLASGPTTFGGGQAIYVSTFDDNEADERTVAPDLYASRNGGAAWLNLGAIPGGMALLLAPVDAADRLWAGSRGAWLLEAASMPTATPNPAQELLRNRSFEYQDVWRIPDTAYAAGYSQERHFAGYWSMRSGIVTPADNVRSYSDFSQDITLPLVPTITLHLHRWPASGGAAAASAALETVLAAQDLDQFQRLLAATEEDLQYALLIEQPSNRIHFLYARLDNQQAWLEESYELSRYAGQNVRLQFGTFNNGSGSLAAQYFDLLSVEAVASTTYNLWMPEIVKDTGGGTIPPAP